MIIASVLNKSNITEIPEVTSLRRQQWEPSTPVEWLKFNSPVSVRYRVILPSQFSFGNCFTKVQRIGITALLSITKDSGSCDFISDGSKSTTPSLIWHRLGGCPSSVIALVLTVTQWPGFKRLLRQHIADGFSTCNFSDLLSRSKNWMLLPVTVWKHLFWTQYESEIKHTEI